MGSKEVLQSGELRCLLVSRAPVAGYPPVLYQAELLSEHGFTVAVADRARESQTSLTLAKKNIEYHPLASERISHSVLGRGRDAISFGFSVRRLLRKLQPHITIAYDVEACAAVKSGTQERGGLLVWHFHELWQSGAKSIAAKMAIRYVRHHARKPDLIVIPDGRRAQLFASATGVSRDRIRLVMNCPRTLHSVPTVAHSTSLDELVPSSGRRVVYNGSVGPDHGLETAVRSIAHWPADALLIVKGHAKPGYDRTLANLASECGVSHRLVRVAYSPGYGSYVGAHIGWTVLEPIGDNYKYSAGASNKRFECMAVGIPQISDNTPATAELIDGIGCGLCIPPRSVEAAAAAVGRLLGDETLRADMGRRARKAHLQGLNYEAQFEPIIAWLHQTLIP
jgi:glycosyltransferase involved in cell wall biosynthesis